MPDERNDSSQNPDSPHNTFDLMGGGPLERAYVTQHKGGWLRTFIVAVFWTAIVGDLLYILSLAPRNDERDRGDRPDRSLNGEQLGETPR